MWVCAKFDQHPSVHSGDIYFRSLDRHLWPPKLIVSSFDQNCFEFTSVPHETLWPPKSSQLEFSGDIELTRASGRTDGGTITAAPDFLYVHFVSTWCKSSFSASVRSKWAIWCSFGILGLTCELASDGKTLLRSGERRYRHHIIHVCAQVGDGGLSRRRRQSKLFRWFPYKKAESQREEIRKLHRHWKKLVPTGHLSCVSTKSSGSQNTLFSPRKSSSAWFLSLFLQIYSCEKC